MIFRKSFPADFIEIDTFNELKEAFPDVSDMTLRTDLKTLDQGKQLVRIHGGARSIDLVMGTEGVMTWRTVTNLDKKEMIARKARTLVFPNSTIYIDSGSTTTMFASKYSHLYREYQLCDRIAEADQSKGIPSGRSDGEKFTFSIWH